MKKHSIWRKYLNGFNLFVTFLIIYATGSCYWIFTQTLQSDENFTSENTCPACFGQSFCPHFYSDRIVVPSLYKLYFSGKTFYRAQYKTQTRNRNVLIKKLATKQAFEDLDLRICANAKLAPDCDISTAITTLPDVKDLKHFSHGLKHLPAQLFYCPSTRLVERVISKYHEIGLSRNSDIVSKLPHLWTTASLNPEPLILQVLNLISLMLCKAAFDVFDVGGLFAWIVLILLIS